MGDATKLLYYEKKLLYVEVENIRYFLKAAPPFPASTEPSRSPDPRVLQRYTSQPFLLHLATPLAAAPKHSIASPLTAPSMA